MTKLMTESWAQVREEQKIKTRSAVKLIAAVTSLRPRRYSPAAAPCFRTRRRQR